MSPIYFLAIFVALVMSLFIPAPASAQSDTARAKSLYERGMRAYKSGEYERAVSAFRRSYKLAPKSMLLYNLSFAQAKLGDFGEALESAKAADFGGDLEPKARVKNSARIGSLSTHKMALAVAANVRDLKSVALAPPRLIRTTTVEAPPQTSPLVPVGIATTIVGALGLGTAATVNFLIADDVAEFDMANDSGDSVRATALKSDLETPVTIGQASLIGGAVLAVTGVTLWLIGANQTGSEKQSFRPSPGRFAWTF